MLFAAIAQLTAGQQQLTAGQQQLTAAVQSLAPLVTEAALARQQRLNPWHSTNRSKAEQSKFKDDLLTFYGCAEGLIDQKPWARCMVSGLKLPQPVVIASHVWKHSTQGAGLVEFGLTIDDLNSKRNGLLLSSEIEKHFDVLDVAFSYDLLTDTFTFHVLDASLLPLHIVNTTDKKMANALNGYPPLSGIPTFEALDGKVMPWKTPNLPFRRLLAWHYALALTKFRRRSASAPADPLLATPAPVLPEHLVRSPGFDERSPEVMWPDLRAMDLYDHAASRSQRDAAEEAEFSDQGD